MMAKRKQSRADRRRAERAGASQSSRPSGGDAKQGDSGGGFSWSVVGWGAAGLVIVVLLGVAFLAGGEPIAADPVTESLARSNAGTEIEIYRGRAHTVYHSTEDLPSDEAPRADGQPTLVWFPATWCTVCERMAPFAHQVASEVRGDVRFVEKSVDHDRSAASRYGVRGTPTFVLIDARGKEIARFHAQLDPTSFAAAIESVIAQAGAG
jgi:thiol-disulfide isomerase/thioredoxin